MSKKKTNIGIGELLLCVATILGLIAFFMMFLPAVKGTGRLLGSEQTFNGTQVIFGYKEGDTEILKFSFPLFLGLFLLPLAGAISGSVTIVMKKNIFAVICLIVFVAAAIMAFLTGVFFNAQAEESAFGLYKWGLGIGSILSGIFSSVAAVCVALKIALKK